MVRLGIAEDQPVCVQQWTGLIAVNYPARKFGITRHMDVSPKRYSPVTSGLKVLAVNRYTKQRRSVHTCRLFT